MIEIYKDYCTGCRVCEKSCPAKSIEMKPDINGFLYPVVYVSKCVKCEICKKKCPINNIEIERNIIAYAAYNKDEKVRLDSSSGGLFAVFASYIIDNQGIVFGAAFNNELLVEHIGAEDYIGLKKIMKSKYLQSDLKNTFEEAKYYLDKGRLVYFSGTPCQIEGLYSYLSRDYDNLITQDLICHGVPSQNTWKKYLEQKNKKVKYVDFRCKEKNTWQNYQVKIEYDDGEIEYINHDKDKFIQMFLSDRFLRDSCYKCKFKKKNRVSDITLADFWGIENIDKSMYDSKGTSLLIVNSDKAKNLVNKLSNYIVKKEINLEEAIKYNMNYVKSVDRKD